MNRQTSNLVASSRPPVAARSRRQGSLLVLVVVCLVLMALLGTAYLQVARVDRLATADTYQSNIDQVASATINYIAKVLRDDLVDQNDAFFSQPGSAPYTDGSGDEPYDYPWTNTAYADQWNVTFDDGDDSTYSGKEFADGGILDDTWLASTTPAFTNTDATWPHISNLMGTYLQLPSSTGSQQPTEMATKRNDTTNGWRNDSNVPLSNTSPFTDGTNSLADPTSAAFLPLGVDTDMDGIPDAKWQWAPLRQIGSVKYVMAVRIIDNSSLLNLATGSALSSDGNNVTDARGYFPSEIDLSRIVARMPITGPVTWQQELATKTSPLNQESLFFRRGLSTALPTPLGLTVDAAGQVTWPTAPSKASRAGAWFNNIQLWNGVSNNKIALANEMELRRLSGVNNDRVTTSLEEAMPTLLRQLSTESLYTDIPYGSITSPEQKRIAFFQGSDPSDASNPNASVADRQYPSLRNQFTTQSAATLFAGNYAGIGRRDYDHTNLPPTPSPNLAQAPHRLKYDLVHQDGGSNITNNPGRLTALYKRLFAIFRISNSGNANAYLGLNATTDANELADIAAEYALAIQDYSDADRSPSSFTATATTGRTYYALEMMPFFREAYIQAAYENQDLRDALGDPNPDTIPDTWVYATNSAALAVEVANPFDKAIDLGSGPAIRLRVGSDSNVYPLTGTLNSHQSRVYYVNTPASDRRAEGDEPTPRGDLLADLNLTAGPDVVALAGSVADIVGDEVVFELQIQDAAGNWVTYDRLMGSRADVTPGQIFFDATNDHNDITALPADLGKFHFYQFNIVRPGTIGGIPGPYYLSNNNSELLVSPRTVNKPAYTAGFSKLTLDDKALTNEGDPDLTYYQLPNANRQFLSVSELGLIHMFGFYAHTDPAQEIQGDFPYRMDTVPANRRRLDLSGTYVPDSVDVTHAAILFDQFTTISPRYDGEDNDDDNVNDNEAEQFVRGQININTAPLHILTLGAPLNESIADSEQLMRTILQYRDDPATRIDLNEEGAAVRSNAPGIASIGELLMLTNRTNLPADQQRIDGYRNIDNTTGTDSFTGTNVDIYPLPENTAAQRHPSPWNGNEQKLARFQFLSQVFNTRSDTFTAFVRLRGYPANDFSNGEVESRNFLVVYDRSNIITASDMPRIIGVYVYNVP